MLIVAPRPRTAIALIADIGQALETDSSVEHRVLWTLEVMRELIPYDLAVVVSDESDQEILVASGESKKLIDEQLQDYLRHLLRDFVDEDDPHLISPLVASQDHRFASAIGLPLVSFDAVTGLVFVGCVAPHQYSEDHVQLLAVIASQLASYLTSVRLLRSEASARQLAEQAVAARDRFFSIASHELRTPITGIKGNVQLMRRDLDRGRIDPERLRHQGEAIEHGVARITAMADDLLDAARIQSGSLTIRRVRCDGKDLVRTIVESFRARMTTDHQLRVDLDSGPCPAELDPARIEQVIDNLLDNAVKYSPAGSQIELILRHVDDLLQIVVSDTGIGLPANVAESIFDPFGRAENARRSPVGGLGLGLHICRQIVEAHGGTIRAQSDGEGTGTTFFVQIPCGVA